MWPPHPLFRDASWNNSCLRVLGPPLHHHPTRGGPADQDEFHERYRAMICRSRQPFRELPTEMGLLGCGSAKAAARSGSESSPVNVDVLLLQQALRGLLLNVLTVLVALVSVKVGSVVSAWLLRPLVLRPSGLSTPPQLDNEHLAYLSGGPTRVVELGLAWLVQRGVLRADPSTRKLVLQGGVDEAMPGIARQVLEMVPQLEFFGSVGVHYTCLATLTHYDLTSRMTSLQSQELCLKGLPLQIGF